MRAAIGLPEVERPEIQECLDRLISERESTRPGSTYRFQFNANFRFEDGRELLPYLHSLGITHCYASPILTARKGSQHGYDINDHNSLNPEIGSSEEFEAFAADLKSLGMGLILDIVPNHMGVGYGTNPWWQDVMESGPASAYADFFDIDWRPLKSELAGKVLLPVLGAAYGEELEQGRLELKFEAGSFYVTYYDRRFPLDPLSYPTIFEQLGNLSEQHSDPQWRDVDAPALQALLRNFRELPPSSTTDPEAKARRQRTMSVLKTQLSELAASSQAVQQVIEQAVNRTNGSRQSAGSFDVLHRILEAQSYRLAHWRVSAEEINYRRFFDINDLVGLRMENPAVFSETHKLIRKLLANGSITGIRLDHPDGLLNPVQYFSRVQVLYAASQCCGEDPNGPVAENGIERDVLALCSGEEVTQYAPLYVVVEKILEAGEQLPKDWPVDGTVGYEFGHQLNNLFINSRAQRFFTHFYHRFIGGPIDVHTLIYESKKRIMLSSLSSEVAVLTHRLEDIGSSDRRARDFTRSLLRNAIRETIACFPVYRTYIDARGTVNDRDRAYIQEAIARAKRRNLNANLAVYDFLRSVLLLENTQNNNGSAEQYRKRLLFVMKFQQLTGPVMAKGLEDTACYAYNRFISVNEVGGSPADFGVSLEEFHHGNLERARDWPYSMLGSSTHDSKRSEDVRARLNVLSEMPKKWSTQVTRWRRANRSKKRALGDGRVVPDANEEYFLYQTLVGTWPFQLGAASRVEFTQRIKDYMTKAVHEAKINLSWLSQDQEYVDNLNQFIDRILSPGTSRRPNTFLEDFQQFVQPVFFFGAINGLAQVLLKLTSPGVPDIYRGTELWDFSLVDPDNRRPVDYAQRQSVLRDLQESENNGGAIPGLAADLSDGRGKMWTIMRALTFRRDHHELFKGGSEYIPLFADAQAREHVIAYARRRDGQWVIVLAPRFAYTLMKGEMRLPVEEAWGETAIDLPSSSPAEFTNVLTGESLRANQGRLLGREVFASFPIALLTNV